MRKTLFDLMSETPVNLSVTGRLFSRELEGTCEYIFYPAGYSYNLEDYPWWQWLSDWGRFTVPAFTVCRPDNSFHWFARKLSDLAEDTQ